MLFLEKKSQCLSPDFDENRTGGNCSELRGAVSHEGELRGGGGAEGEGVIIPIGPKGKLVEVLFLHLKINHSKTD